MQIIRHHMQDYPDSVIEQEAIVSEILTDASQSTLILTEHPPVFTIGTSGSEQDILHREIDGEEIAIFPTGRGGEVTYHGPGQLVCYVIADLSAEKDLHKHVWRLEEMVIRTLADFNIQADRNPRGIGVWVNDLKIAAAGVRCRKWISFHGIALNIHPNLKHFSGIVPCGMHDTPVTSMHALGCEIDRTAAENTLISHAKTLFSTPL